MDTPEDNGTPESGDTPERKEKNGGAPKPVSRPHEEAIKRSCDMARLHFSMHQSEIAGLVLKTRKWLEANKETFNAYGARTAGCMYPVPPPSDDPVLIDGRDYYLRCRIFQNGLLDLISRLADESLVPRFTQEDLKLATSYQSMGVHHEMVGLQRSGNNFALNLSDLSNRFDYEQPTKFRNRMVMLMANLGLWTVKSNSGYAITIGPIAYAFHLNAFMPVKEFFQSEKGKAP